MSRAIRVDNIRYGASILEQTEMRVMIRLEQSGVKASGEKMGQIGEELEHHKEREEPCQKRREKRSQKIRAESEKISVDQSGASILLHNYAKRGEDPIREGIQKTTENYTERWKIMQ